MSAAAGMEFATSRGAARMNDPPGVLLEAQKRALEMIVRGVPLKAVLAELCSIVEAQAPQSIRAAILLCDPTGKRLVTGSAPSLPEEYSRAIDGIAIQRDVGTCADAAARGEVVVTPDIDRDPGWRAFKHLPLSLGLRAAWSQPIYSSSGAVLGTFGTYFTELRGPLPIERQLIEVLAHTAALAIERDRADAEIEAGAARHRFIAELAAATQRLIDPSAITSISARLLAEFLEVDRCAYAQIENEQVFIITGDYTRGVPSAVGRWNVADFGPACVEHMRAGKAFVIDDVEDDPRVPADCLPAYRSLRIGALICVPLNAGERFTASLAVHQRHARHWTPAEIDTVAQVVARCWEALERARITLNLQDSEARYRAMIQATPECVKLIDSEGRLLQINPAGLAMMGAADESAVLGRCLYDGVVPEHRERYRAFNERICAGGSGSLQFDLLSLDGRRLSVESNAVPLPAGSGLCVHLSVTRDVTARVTAERALAQSRARLDYAQRISGIGSWHCDLPFSKMVWDDRVREHFFLPPGEPVFFEEFVNRLHPEDREPTLQRIEDSIREHAAYDTSYRTVNPADGAIKWIRALGGTSYSADGTPVRFDGFTVDITEEKRDQERLASLLERVSEQDRRKDEFLATLAHELRNPLAPIRNGLQILRKGSGEHSAKAHEMMERQLGHLVRMVDDLLDISRVTLGKITLKKERLDFRAVLHSALETTRALVEAGEHEFAVRLPKDPLPIEGDLTRLAQVMANLVNNAAKYTPAGGRIQLTVETEGKILVVRLQDSGVGIPPDMLPQVFDMFTQVGQSIDRAQGGLGIGLTLVRRLVEMHGGTVSAESAGIGQGSVFTVRLPLAPSVVATEDAAPASESELGARRRVLVVDDNVDAAESLAMLLGLEGHETRMAHTGEEALAVAREFIPDTIFLDIGLPVMNGYEVARQIRADDAFDPQPRLIALTGWGAEDDRRQAHAAGFDTHLVKPVDPSVLGRILTS
jgi:PAS domain S-box-containing protein